MKIRLALTFTVERSRPREPADAREPSYGDGYLDNAGTLAENLGHPPMIGFQREERTDLE